MSKIHLLNEELEFLKPYVSDSAVTREFMLEIFVTSSRAQVPNVKPAHDLFSNLSIFEKKINLKFANVRKQSSTKRKDSKDDLQGPFLLMVPPNPRDPFNAGLG